MYQLNIIKSIKKEYKRSSWKIPKSFYRWKRKKWQYGCECYKNLSEDEKQKLIDYRKKYYRMRKNALL